MSRRRVRGVADNGPPPAAAAALYAGEVMHARLKPVAHRFVWRVFTVLVDLDRLAEAGRLSPLFSVDRFNVVSLHQRDHGPRDGSPLAPHVRRLVAEAAPGRAVARILMLAYPRVLGQVFNPITVYFACGEGGEPVAIVYEVRNTFGGMHSYVLPVAPGEASEAGIRQSQEKTFFVSPFIEMRQTYDFRILPPGEAVRIRILESDPEGPILSATFGGRRSALSTRTLLSALASARLLPFKVLGAIHIEAVRLLLKGVKGLPIPRAAKGTTVSVRRPGSAAGHATGGRGAAPIRETATGRLPG